MTYPKTKEQITKVILAEIPESHWHGQPVDKTIFRWWLTGRSGSSLRLSEEGKIAFEMAKVEYYEYPLVTETGVAIKGNSIRSLTIEISKKIDCPYWIGTSTIDNKKKVCIRIYDDKIALVLSLFGTLRDYLDSLDNRIE